MLSKKFLKTISEFILSNNLMDKKKKHLVALSGGSDSVCLTLALKCLGYNIELAHCNFHLRKEESNSDEEFCREFALKEGLNIHIAHFDTTAFAKGHKISIEMAARELRYSYFENLRKDLDLGAICVAHHRDDSIETFLLNLMRGTGINGLLGIKPKNGYIVRPLLSVWHSDIEKELQAINQEFVTDSTNLIDDFTRNKIRLNILPEMIKINPSVKESIFKTLERFSLVANAYNSIMEDMAKKATLKSGDTLKIKLDYLSSSKFSQGLLFYILSKYSFTSKEVEQAFKMINSFTGKRLVSSKNQLLVDREYMIIEQRAKKEKVKMKIPETGVYALTNGAKLKVEVIPWDNTKKVEKDSCYFFADKEKVKFPLEVRSLKRGDRFFPFGMRGTKLISDFLTDKKVNLFDKERQMVLTDALGNILWLINQRTDDRVRVRKTTTEVVLITYFLEKEI